MLLFVLAASALLGQWVGLSGTALSVACAAVLGGLLAGLGSYPFWGGRRAIALAAAVALLCAVCGWLSAPGSLPADTGHVVSLLGGEVRSSGKVGLIGDIVAPPRPSGTGLRLLLEAHETTSPERRALRGRINLFIMHTHRSWYSGQRLAFRSSLRRIGNYGNPGEFDWAGWNARRGVLVSAFVWDDSQVQCLGPDPEQSWTSKVRNRIARAALEGGVGEGAALVAALASGDRGALGRPAIKAMRAAGLAHVLAISGLHMGLVAGILFWAVSGLARIGGAVRRGLDVARPASVVAACGVIFYALISGGGVSVARSLIMTLAALATAWRGVTADGSRALALAVLLLAFIAPGAVCEPGFQLSFVAVAALLAYGKRLRRLHRCLPWGLRMAITALCISFLCWWVTTPIVALHFNRVSIVAPLVNVVVAPAVAATVAGGLTASLALLASEHLALLLFRLAAWPAALVLAVARYAAGLPGAGLPVPSPGAGLAAVLVAAPFAVCLPRWRKPVLVALLLAAAVLTSHALWQRFRSDRLDLLFVSVGQGAATIVRLPGGKVILVDSGRPGRVRQVIGPLLRRLGIGRIDYLVITHVQADHWGGAPELSPDFEIGELWYPGGGSCELPQFHAYLAELRRHGVRIVRVGRRLERGPSGKLHRSTGGALIEALWPNNATGDCADNNRSVVLRLSFEGISILLAGDIEAEAERALLALPGMGPVDLLKVPHHGSRTSSTQPFLDALHPRVAVISVGRGNSYGFPHPDVLSRYRRIKARLLRTDRGGAVLAAVQGGTLRAHSAGLR